MSGLLCVQYVGRHLLDSTTGNAMKVFTLARRSLCVAVSYRAAHNGVAADGLLAQMLSVATSVPKLDVCVSNHF